MQLSSCRARRSEAIRLGPGGDRVPGLHPQMPMPPKAQLLIYLHGFTKISITGSTSVLSARKTSPGRPRFGLAAYAGQYSTGNVRGRGISRRRRIPDRGARRTAPMTRRGSVRHAIHGFRMGSVATTVGVARTPNLPPSRASPLTHAGNPAPSPERHVPTLVR